MKRDLLIVLTEWALMLAVILVVAGVVFGWFTT